MSPDPAKHFLMKNLWVKWLLLSVLGSNRQKFYGLAEKACLACTRPWVQLPAPKIKKKIYVSMYL
jgi:hypothetical protein